MEIRSILCSSPSNNETMTLDSVGDYIQQQSLYTNSTICELCKCPKSNEPWSMGINTESACANCNRVNSSQSHVPSSSKKNEIESSEGNISLEHKSAPVSPSNDMMKNSTPNDSRTGSPHNESISEEGENITSNKRKRSAVGSDESAEKNPAKKVKKRNSSAKQPNSPNSGSTGAKREKDTYYCKYCDTSWPYHHFRNAQQFGAHCSNCSRKRKVKDPQEMTIRERNKRMRKAKKESPPKKEKKNKSWSRSESDDSASEADNMDMDNEASSILIKEDFHRPVKLETNLQSDPAEEEIRELNLFDDYRKISSVGYSSSGYEVDAFGLRSRVRESERIKSESI